MIPTRADIRKQIAVALYSSLAVSVLTTTPVFMMTRISFGLYPWTLLFTTGLTVAMWGVNILIFYFAQGSRVLRYSASYIVTIVLAVMMFHGLLLPRSDGGFGGSKGFYFHIILFFAVDTVLLIVQDLVVVRGQNAELRMRNIEAANLLLKQQVQPHFLFNSLSTLKSLIKYSPADAEEYVVKLSGFLRSSMAAHASALVSVEAELGLCRDYLEMQRIRFGEALSFLVDVRESGFLPVFAVQGLIENAIKHNVLTKERPLRIRITGEGGTIRVSNNLQLRDGVEKGGMGLANLRERYAALGEGVMVVANNENEFSVTIPILQNESGNH